MVAFYFKTKIMHMSTLNPMSELVVVPLNIVVAAGSDSPRVAGSESVKYIPPDGRLVLCDKATQQITLAYLLCPPFLGILLFGPSFVKDPMIPN
jgi:hypothetical protein